MAPGVRIDTNVTVDNITTNSAQCGGNNISQSTYTILEKGLCWSSTNTSPTISDNYFNQFPLDPTINNFVCSMTGLNPNTLYYVCAYLKSTAGTPYFYSNLIRQFTTLSGPPPKPKVISIGTHGTRLNGKKITLIS